MRSTNPRSNDTALEAKGNRRKLLGTTLVAAVGLACILHQLPEDREIVLTATGPDGAAVEGFATADDVRQELLGVLPQTWTFTASKLSVELRQTSPESVERICLTKFANSGTVEDESVQGGRGFTDFGPISSTDVSIGGTWIVE